MQLSAKEKVGLWIGVAAAIIPALIVAGFFPDFNILPLWSWIVFAAMGSCIGGAVAADKSIYGAVAGGIAGLGMILGVLGYIAARSAIFNTDTFLRAEIAIGGLIGAAPGLIAYWKLARKSKE